MREPFADKKSNTTLADVFGCLRVALAFLTNACLPLTVFCQGRRQDFTGHHNQRGGQADKPATFRHG